MNVENHGVFIKPKLSIVTLTCILILSHIHCRIVIVYYNSMDTVLCMK